MNYIFIINDYQYLNSSHDSDMIDAFTLAKKLFQKKIWIHPSKKTPFLRTFEPKDKVLLYIAGIGRRYFYASFEICGEVVETDFSKLGDFDSNFIKRFKYSHPISNIDIWNNPVPMIEIKNELNFIKDKKNYGLYLRNSVVKLEESDYKFIISKK